MTGPLAADASVPSMRWMVGLQVNVDPSTVSAVRFSCAPIPGSAFDAGPEVLRIHDTGAVFADGPVLAVSRETTPWLFEATPTMATCRAVVSRDGHADILLEETVTYDAADKAGILEEITAPRVTRAALPRP